MPTTFQYDHPNYTVRREVQGASVVVGSAAQKGEAWFYQPHYLVAAHYFTTTAGTTTGATGIARAYVIGTATTTVSGSLAITTQAAGVRSSIQLSTPVAIPSGARCVIAHTAEATGAGQAVWEVYADPVGTAS